METLPKTFRYKVGNLEPGLKLTFRRAGVDEDVSSHVGTGKMFRRGDPGTGGTVFDGRTLDNVTGVTNQKTLAFQSGDTDEAGFYEIEINIALAGRPETAPIRIDIEVYE